MTTEDFEVAVGQPLEAFAYQCHVAALAVVRSGVLGPSRVARGTCPGVGGQHSWVVLGDDCYSREATVVDPTLWSYDSTVEGIWTGPASERPHEPFGSGSIWEYGQPSHQGGETIECDTSVLSPKARAFMEMILPLDRAGWAQLAHAPVGDRDWPSEEIIGWMYANEKLNAMIPVDIVGMITDFNPGSLYLPTRRAA